MSDSCQDKLSHLERRLALLETYSIEAFWMALDRAYEATLSRRELKCTVCGTTGLRTDFIVLTEHCIFGGGMLERYQCQVCDAVFGPQKYLDLPEEFVSQDYALLYTHYAEINSTENEIRTFRSLDPKPGGLYLNWELRNVERNDSTV